MSSPPPSWPATRSGHGSAAQLLLTAGDNPSACSPKPLRRALRRQPGPGLVRQDNPPSPQPWRRPSSQQRAAHHRHRAASDRSPHQGLRRQAHRRGPFQARGHPVPQALHRARGLRPHPPATTGDQPGPDRRLTHRRASGESQYVSIRYTERLAEAGIEPSVGSVGD